MLSIRWVFLAGFLAFTALVESHAQSLTVYGYDGRDEYKDDSFNRSTTITFYDDGLIKSYVTVDNPKIAAKGETDSFQITREASSISEIFSRTGRKSTTSTYQIGSDVVSIHFPIMKPGQVALLQHLAGLNDQQSVYQCTFQGRPWFIFKSSPKETNLEIWRGRSTTPSVFRYLLDPSTGLPKVVSQGDVIKELQLGQISAGSYFVIRREPNNGRVVASYRIDGEMRTYPSFISVLNLVIVGFDGFGAELYPFIGGLPNG